jgi:hypothetical protein
MQTPNSFDDITERLVRIENYLLELVRSKPRETLEEPDKLLNVGETAQLLKLRPPTIYSMVSRGFLPVSKRGARLYFSRNELLKWALDGKRKTKEEIREEMDGQLSEVL